MKLSCKVIEDLLPLYHDKACSPESSLLVAEHLRDCESCRKLLRSMDDEIIDPPPQEDQKVLEGIRNRWKKANRRAVLRGAALALAAVLLLGAAAGGFWYGTQASRYQALAAEMEVYAAYPHESGRDGSPAPWVFPREYSLFREGYHFWLRLPGFLDFTGGSIAVYPDENHQHWQSSGLRPNVSLGVKLNGDEPYYIVIVDVDGELLASFCVDGELNYIPQEKDDGEACLQILEEYRPEITEIVQAARQVWNLG